MNLILLSPPTLVPNETTILCQLFEAGLTHFHLRKPTFSKVNILDYLLEIPEIYHDRIVLHQYHAFCEVFKLKGIHLPEKVRISQHYPINVPLISTSFHDTTTLLANETCYQYVFLSPIFNSISKPNYPAGFQKEELAASLKQTKQKVIALGGVSFPKVQECKSLGFSGVACIGAVWQNPDPLEAFEQLRNELAFF